MKNKFLLFFGVVCLLIVLFLIAKANRCKGFLGGCGEFTFYVNKPIYKEVMGYGNVGGYYSCSKPIKLVSHRINLKRQATDFSPVDKEEAQLFCHMTAAIEYKGKLTVLQKPEVLQLISKYSYKDVHIKALEFKYIQDKDFVNRLLPTYKGREIGCIIVLETPNEKKVYLEDEKLNTFEELDYQTFERFLNSISPIDRQTFIENLK